MAITKLFLKTSPERKNSEQRKKLWDMYPTKGESLNPSQYILYYAEGFFETEAVLARDYLEIAMYEKEIRRDLRFIQNYVLSDDEYDLSDEEKMFLEGAVALCDYFKEKREEKLVIEEALEPAVDREVVEAFCGDYKQAFSFTKAIDVNMKPKQIAETYRDITGKKKPEDGTMAGLARGLNKMGKYIYEKRTLQRAFEENHHP